MAKILKLLNWKSRKKKTVNRLIRENPNLNAAVRILLEGCIEKNAQSHIQKWDNFRKREEDQEKC